MNQNCSTSFFKTLLVFMVICAARFVSAAENMFTAAVYEHSLILPPVTSVPLSRARALEVMMTNIRVYQEQTKIASNMGANIIVFPEDGIYGMFLKTRELLYPFMEYIPEPELSWNPCEHTVMYPDTEIQFALSCMARDNNIYVVANIGDKQPCNVTFDPRCPDTGYYQYNTDVAYDTRGNLIAKYHKYNLFYEFQFDKPARAALSVFDTPFGRFGLFTCFDVLFEHPPIDLICRHNISNIAFPTAWMDAGPFFNSVQFHSAFAVGLGVNFLAANVHYPTFRFHGSGIYTPQGAAGYYYNTSTDSGGQLIVREIPVIKQPRLDAYRGIHILQPDLNGAMHTLDNSSDILQHFNNITDTHFDEKESFSSETKTSTKNANSDENNRQEQNRTDPYPAKAAEEIEAEAIQTPDVTPSYIRSTETLIFDGDDRSTDTAENTNNLLTEIHPTNEESITDAIQTLNNVSSSFSFDKTDLLLEHGYHNDTFQYDLFYDTFNLVPLRPEGGESAVCHTDLCCHLSYRLEHIDRSAAVDKTDASHDSDCFQASQRSTNHFNASEGNKELDNLRAQIVNSRQESVDEFYALGAFDGLHVYQGRYYIQVCTMIRCRKIQNVVNCSDSMDEDFGMQFGHFELIGNFSTTYLYPEILLHGEHDFLLTEYPKRWDFSEGRLLVNDHFRSPLAVAAIFSRDYAMD